tara:strand:+ start:1937 stop:2290 length:354 start_codon:yes stop_codon:yes gene_type:complete
MKEVAVLPVFRSEEFEPMAAHFVGTSWKRCELLYAHAQKTGEYRDHLKFDSAIESFWYGMNALTQLVIATQSSTPHFSVALSNEMQKVNDYIKERTGYCAITNRPEDHRLHLTLSSY